MKVTMFSNFLNHHQLPFCEEMVRLLGGDFTFVATEAFNPGQVSRGYADMNTAYGFCLPSYADETRRERAKKLARESAAAIYGSAPEEYVTERLRAGKGLTFRYSERLYKPVYTAGQRMRTFLGQLRTQLAARAAGRPPVYLLCAGAYVAADYRKSGAYKNRAYKWGYFPQGSVKPVETLLRQKGHAPLPMLWAGRMIDWKHGEDAVRLGKAMKDAGLDFSLQMIGDGPCRAEWERLAVTQGVADHITFTGALQAAEVIEKMEESAVYLFTSDASEGWGAVLNESMSAGCAVLANRAIGAAPYLLRHKENGLVYGSFEQLQQLGLQLAKDPAQVAAYGRAARKTIDEMWNAKHAAVSFLALCEHLQENKTGSPIADGPGSPA